MDLTRPVVGGRGQTGPLGSVAAERPLQLPVGAPGKVGLLAVAFAPVRGRTRVVELRQRVPLRVLRALYTDPAEPSVAHLTILTPVGGLVQGDRLRLRLAARRDAAVRVTTAAATNVYAMEADEARLDAELSVEAGARLEYLPRFLIPHRDASYRQRTRLVVDPEGCLIHGEIVLPGRLHMGGEAMRYRRLDLGLRVERPEGETVCADRLLLAPQGPTWPRGWPDGETILGTLLCLCPQRFHGRIVRALRGAAAAWAEPSPAEPSPAEPSPAEAIAVREAASGGTAAIPAAAGRAAVRAGVSLLPYGCGVAGRFLARDPVAAAALMDGWGQAVRQVVAELWPA